METKQIRYCQEDLVSRVPGLFPYLEFGENGLTTVHSAKDSPNGCYGHVPCGIKLPDDTSLVYNGVEFLTGGSSYSYRTLMNLYYRYKGLIPDDDPFVVFMERCIGMFRVYDEINLPDCDLIPEYAYYAECSRLYTEYSSISAICSAYMQFRSMNEINCDMECLVGRYARMGGDTMRDYYYQKSVEAETIADELFDTIADINAGSIDVSLNIVSSENDLGVLAAYIDYWEPNRRYVGGDLVIYNDRTYICTCEEGLYTEGSWDPDTETVVFDYGNFTLLSESDYTQNIASQDLMDTIGEYFDVSGTMQSMLPVFKESLTYTNEGGTATEPKDGEDWLWYYKIGALGNYETSTDEYGNINIKEGGSRNELVGSYETDLMAYGDVLTNIECDEDLMTVTFTYVIGANLKAELKYKDTDDNGVTRYYYGGYAYNENDPHGVVCTETYPFVPNNSDITTLINNGHFANYVSNSVPEYRYFKCPFDTSYNTSIISMTVNGIPVTVPAVIGGFNVSVSSDRDILVSPVIKKDYLVGIAAPPYYEENVFINRGDSAAWERHVKLGDIKTFDDLSTYSNGGFFNLM
jgi:hypothetical protein